MAVGTDTHRGIKETPPGRRIGEEGPAATERDQIATSFFRQNRQTTPHTSRTRQIHGSMAKPQICPHDGYRIRKTGRFCHPLDLLLPFACGPSIRPLCYFLSLFLSVIGRIDQSLHSEYKLLHIMAISFVSDLIKRRKIATALPRQGIKMPQTVLSPACRESQEPPARPRARHP